MANQKRRRRRKLSPFCALAPHSLAKLNHLTQTLLPQGEEFVFMQAVMDNLASMKNSARWATESGSLVVVAAELALFHHAHLSHLEEESDTTPKDWSDHGAIMLHPPQEEEAFCDCEECTNGPVLTTEDMVMDMIENADLANDETLATRFVYATMHNTTLLQHGDLKNRCMNAVAEPWLAFLETLPIQYTCAEQAVHFIPTGLEHMSLSALATTIESVAMQYAIENDTTGLKEVQQKTADVYVDLSMAHLLLTVARECKLFPQRLEREIQAEFSVVKALQAGARRTNKKPAFRMAVDNTK